MVGSFSDVAQIVALSGTDLAPIRFRLYFESGKIESVFYVLPQSRAVVSRIVKNGSIDRVSGQVLTAVSTIIMCQS